MPILVQLDQSIRIAEVLVVNNDNVWKSLHRSVQIGLRSLKSFNEFFVGNVVAALAHAHGHALDRFCRTINLDKDENNGIPKSYIRCELVNFLTDGIR